MQTQLMIGLRVTRTMLEQNWNDKIRSLPGSHILQTREWGEIKSVYGWQVLSRTWEDEAGLTIAAAQILRKRITLAGIAIPYSIMYIPRGPMLDWSNAALVKRVLEDLKEMAKKENAIQLKIDAEYVFGRGTNGNSREDVQNEPVEQELTRLGWRYSSEQIQFKNTVWLALDGDEEALLARMKQKTRYNIRLAQKKGVTVRQVGKDAFPSLYRMYAATSLRDGFAIRNKEYYFSVWQKFMDSGMAHALLAEVEGQPVAGLMLFHFAGRAWYLYGMSTELHREKMPNYLLQWEAMRLAANLGCTVYDLWGAPDVFNDTDSMWGVYRFKEGLGGEVVRTLGAWDYSPLPILYALYIKIIPLVTSVMRMLGKKQTAAQLEK